MISESAPAKINLYLHVGPVRADGLHALRSLFVFGEDGDIVTAQSASDISLEIIGPFASALADEDPSTNLVWRAAEVLRDYAGVTTGAALTLDKRLPVAAGIGGGSADAAAAFRALCALWEVEISESALEALAFDLGADIPACLSAAPLNVSGGGEILEPGPSLPPLWACLANARVAVPTGPIFNAFDAENPAPPSPTSPAATRLDTYDAVVRLMAETRNDLQPHAVAREARIEDTLKVLAAADGALAARMSGSGATCFALFSTEDAATSCVASCEAHGFWAMATQIAGARGR